MSDHGGADDGALLARAHHLQPVLILLVAVGGVLGTLARYALNVLIPVRGDFPVITLLENLVGAFLLGVLLEILARPVPETRGRRAVRLGLGTGVLGGFTTYSAFALELRDLVANGRVWLGLGYGLGSVLLGVLVCAGGVLLSSAGTRRRAALMPQDPDADHLQAQSLAPERLPREAKPRREAQQPRGDGS